MLRPAKMRKIRIFALSSAAPAVVKKLHELGVVEIKRFKAEGLQDGRPLQEFDDVSERLLKIRSIASALKLKENAGEYADKSVSSLLEEADHLNKTIGEKINALMAKKAEDEERLKKLNSDLQVVSKLLPFNIDFKKMSTNTLSFVLGELDQSRIEDLKNRLKNITDAFDVLAVHQRRGKPALVLVVYQKNAPIESALVSLNFSVIDVPPDVGVPSEALARIKEEIEKRNDSIKLIDKNLADLSAKHGAQISLLLNSLSIAAERAGVFSKFATSKMAVALEGWIKEADYKSLSKELGAFGDSVFLQDAPIGHDEKVPVVLENPQFARPFEFVSKEYSLPNYFEFDPSLLYLLTLPILYGMIVGDALYGIASIPIAKWFMEKFKTSETMRNVCMLWLYSAFPTIIFGAIFNEWAGMTLSQWASYLAGWGLPDFSAAVAYEGLSRLHNFSFFLGVTLLAGFLHLALGFILGAIKNWNHHRKHAYAKLAWLGVEVGGVAAICSSFLGVLPAYLSMPALAVFIISAVGLFLTEGLVGIFELPGLGGNILSYARIAAVGVVGVVLAEIINEFFLPTVANGLLALVLFPLLIVLHALNAFIAMFEALIQGGRLNVIEFKSKFVDGGGVLFSPFRLRSKKMKR
jgi:V/A-type H+-transporting ATPase subunit I